MADEEVVKTSDVEDSPELESSSETLQITVNRATNEAILQNPKDGRIIKLKADFVESLDEKLELEEKGDDSEPLSPEDFEKGINRLMELGLTFSVDLFPIITAKNEDSAEIFSSDKFEALQKEFPGLPREVGLTAHNTITGNSHGLNILGGKESYEKKSKIVRELVINSEYKEKFFFQHALKVPYIDTIDWEIVLKMQERGVKDSLSIPYALLMFTLHNPNPRHGQLDAYQNFTAAVNLDLIDKTLATFTEIRAALTKSYKIQENINKKELVEG